MFSHTASLAHVFLALRTLSSGKLDTEGASWAKSLEIDIFCLYLSAHSQSGPDLGMNFESNSYEVE